MSRQNVRVAPELMLLAHGLNRLRREGKKKLALGHFGEEVPAFTVLTELPEDLKIWEEVEKVVIAVIRETQPRTRRSLLTDPSINASLENGVWWFNNWLANSTPARFVVRLKKNSSGRAIPQTSFVAHDPASVRKFSLASILWKHFFGEKGYERLKPCQQCGEWFVDHGSNKRGTYCQNGSCANRYWNRPQRRAANHSQYVRKPKGK